MYGTPVLVQQALNRGAQGYILKPGAAKELLSAIHQVNEGGTYLSPSLNTMSGD
jgi:two-component system response regulator NreC